jgi:hypothetical protein
MNSSSEQSPPDVQGVAPAGASQGEALFPNDTGRLPAETRRAIVLLLLGPSVDARRQSKLWPVLLRDEAVIRSRLHELFLDLVVDRDQQVAFTRQITAEELDIPVLLRKARLTFLESALLLLLRSRLTQADAQGERAAVSVEEMREHLRVFERTQNPDRARFEQQMDNAIEKAKKLSLLRRIRGSEERYEVSPTLKLLFPAEEIQALTRIYATLAASVVEEAGGGAPDDNDDETDSREDT